MRYVRDGTRYECLKKGIGTGRIIETNKNVGSDDLLSIKYVGPKTKARLVRAGFGTTRQLIKEMRKLGGAEIDKILTSTLVKTDGNVDWRAYNSVLLFLHERGIDDLPSCRALAGLQ